MPEFTVTTILQVTVALGLLNVWLLRASNSTAYRGGESKTLKQEFKTYGLPEAAFYVVGALKIGSAIILLAGLWFALPVTRAAGIVMVLMIGALVAHFRAKDPLKKSLPAFLMLLMSAGIVFL